MRDEMAGFDQQRVAATRPRARAKVLQPEGAKLLTFETVGSHLGLTAAAVRKLIEGREDGPDSELAKMLRSNLVTLSPRRRFIKGPAFAAWLSRLAMTWL